MTNPWPPAVSAAAARALEQAGHHTLVDLAGADVAELGAIPGVGPKTIMALATALDEAGTPLTGMDEARKAWRQQARPGSAKWAGSGHKSRSSTKKLDVGEPVMLDVAGHQVRLSSPQRVYFPDQGWTKLDVAHYYLAVGEGILRATRDRPTMLHRFPDGLAGEKVYQKRIPNGKPDWVPTVRLDFPRYGLHADELAPASVADLIWAVQMSTVEFHPWNVRASDVDRPDELRIDLDPMPEAGFDQVRAVASVAHEVLDELGITGYPKTSGGNGLHIYVRLRPDWDFGEVRRAAWGFAREVVSRIPQHSTVTWWRKDRDPAHVFLDFNQNARDHTLAAAYSLRGVPAGTVSTPISWAELDEVDPQAFTLATVPARFEQLGDLTAGIDDQAFGLETLLEWADRFEAAEGQPPEPTEQESTHRTRAN